jgi:2-aminoadipate transaminase
MRPPFTDWVRSSNDITRQFLAIGGRADMISLAGGLPAAELYPVEAVAAAAENALSRWGGSVLEYGPVEGFAPLRETIAARMSAATGSRFGVENVLLTSGSMQGLDLLGKALIDPGDLVVTQTPTYLGALDAWRPRRPRYEPLDWDSNIPVSDHALSGALGGAPNGASGGAPGGALGAAKFVYAVPNYSNPTGVLVSQAARQNLLRRVQPAGLWVVEDDPYAPLQLDGPAGPSLLAIDADGRDTPYRGQVVYLGTVSKSLAPGLRVGWAVAAPEMIETLALAKQGSDLSGSLFTQAIAHTLLDSGLETSHIPRIVAAYRERRDALCASAALHLSEWFTWTTPPGGMFLWITAKHPRVDTAALYNVALEEKVAFVPGHVFDPQGGTSGAIRLNFSRNPPAVLAEGTQRLARAMRRYLGD